MRILVVGATPMEVAPLVGACRRLGGGGPRIERYAHAGHEIDVLTSGVGMVATAVWCTRALAQTAYDAALNVGVCGSFDPALSPGTVVHVVSDRIAELGAEDDEAFLTIGELGLAAEWEVVNEAPPPGLALAALPSVRGITVNTVHGSERSIADVVRRFRPQVESMEGAAFMYACATGGVPYAQVRAVSNFVERRNRAAWKVTEAVASLGRTATEVLAFS